MSCISVLIKFLGRFPNSKFQKQKIEIFTVRNKTSVAVLENVKLSDCSTIQLESGIFNCLQKAAPIFPVDGSKISVMYEPSKFFSTLLKKCKTAKTRITLASLYLGTGKLEQELVNSIKESMDSSDVKVKILLDYIRGSRGKINSKEMLLPLLEDKFKLCCHIFLYHTPTLRGFLKRFTPDRFNELIGLQHMKLYLFDDTLIISGANLSDDYFSNRQDRYFMIEDCKELCDFYCNLVDRVTEFSFKLQADGTTIFSNKFHPFKSSRKHFTAEASNKIHSLFQEQINKCSKLQNNEILKLDTWIFPLVQMGQLNIRHDSLVTLNLLKKASVGATLRLATGYFNLTSEYRKAILNECKADCHFLTSHPKANGFFGAKGVAGRIPAAYSKIEESFFKMCEKLSQSDRIHLWEFIKYGWTYHAKGLWYSIPGEKKPCLTLIGSSNFGYRSVERDLETQVAIMTKNKELQKSLQKEYERLFYFATPVTKNTFLQKERISPSWVKIAVFFFRYYF